MDPCLRRAHSPAGDKSHVCEKLHLKTGPEELRNLVWRSLAEEREGTPRGKDGIQAI